MIDSSQLEGAAWLRDGMTPRIRASHFPQAIGYSLMGRGSRSTAPSEAKLDSAELPTPQETYGCFKRSFLPH